MKANNIFDIKRLYLLVRRQVLSNAPVWLIAFGAVAGTLLVISLLVAYFQPQNLTGLSGLYFTVMFIGGYVYTSNIFGELHQSQKSYQYLTLPVSTTERLFSAWILTAVLFPLVSVVLMALIVFLANLVMNFTFDVTPFQSVFSNSGWTAVKVYAVTQSVFLLGAVYFRKNNFLKTVLALFVVSVVIQIVIVSTAWILFSPISENGVNIGPQNMSLELEHFIMEYIPVTARLVFWYLTIPFFLTVSWFSLKERQV